MNLYDDVTAATSAPALPTAVSPGYYTEGVAGSVPRSIIRAWHLNALQAEIVNTIVAGGLTPSRADNTQLHQAINALVAAAITVEVTARNAAIASGIAPLATTAALNGAVSTLETLIAADIAPLATTAALTAAVNTINTALAFLAPLAAPVLTKSGALFPTTPTPAAGDSSTNIASTAFVTTALTNASPTGNLSSTSGPWWTWNPKTGEVHIRGVYTASITTEGAITVAFPVNIGTFQSATATAIQNTNLDAAVAQIDTWSTTSLTVFINDNEGGSGTSAQGFMWEAWGYSPTAPTAV
jgi:hypothetical protein